MKAYFHPFWVTFMLSMASTLCSQSNGIVEWCCSSYLYDTGSGWKEVHGNDDTCFPHRGASETHTAPCQWRRNQRHFHGLGNTWRCSFLLPGAGTGTGWHFPSGGVFFPCLVHAGLVPQSQSFGNMKGLYKCELLCHVLCTGNWGLRSGVLRSVGW